MTAAERALKRIEEYVAECREYYECVRILKEEIAKDAILVPSVRAFENSPAGLAQEFVFSQQKSHHRKDEEFGLCCEIKAMVESGWDLQEIAAEIRKSGKERDRSELWWQLKSRMEKQRKPGSDPYKSLRDSLARRERKP